MKRKFIKAHMQAAFVYAALSYCKRRQVGCVIVKYNGIISIGFNGTPSGEENQCEDENGDSRPDVIHAEDNSLRKLTRRNESADGADMFITDAPCYQCATRIVDAGIKKVYYNRVYRLEDGLRYLEKHNVEIEQVEI